MSLNLATFFNDFAALAAAPNGVAKLRELILQLAVQGKLVLQDSNDEPASVLLAKIKAEKERLVQEGKIKKRELLPPIKDEEAPFELPQGWEWARFPELGEFGRGKSKHRPRNDPKLFNGGCYRLVQTGDVARANGLIQTHTGLYNDVGLSQSRMWPKGTLCITIAANIADSGILGFDACFPDSVVGLIPSAEIGSATYFEYFMRTAQNSLLDYAPSTAQKNINLGILETVLIPLPPLKEIRRIVAKVDQLMALCDELEARQQRQQSARVRLNNAALDRWLTARAPEEFAEHWQRLCDNFDQLYDAPATVAALRQAILQLAVQGKLVPQDANDEPASVLLAKIKAEKERLTKEKKIKRNDPLPPIEADEVPFDLPEAWEWVRLGAIIQELRYGTSQHCTYLQQGVPVLRIPNISNGAIDTTDLKFADLIAGELQELRIQPNDLLMIRSNGSKSLVGRLATVAKEQEGFAYAGYLVRLRPMQEAIDSRFLYIVSEAKFFRDQIEHPIRTTSGVKNINSTEIGRLCVSLPPLAEQRRIVAKVDQLMALCDELETKLRQAQSHSAKLMTATVQHLAASV